MVLTVDRGRLTCLVEDRVVMAMKARELGRKAAVVGDRVAIVGDLSGEKDTLARIVRIEQRTSVLRRTADDDDPYERVVVANADQLAIVTALADPEPRPRLIDRCLVAAYDARPRPAAGPDQVGPGLRRQLLEMYGALGVPYVVTSREELEDGDAADRVREQPGRPDHGVRRALGRRQDHAGQRAGRRSAGGRTGVVNAVTGRGRHTTTSALALPLPDDDGLGRSTPRAYGPSACTTSTRPGSSTPSPTWSRAPRAARARAATTSRTARWTQWVAEGHADPARLYSLRRLLATRERREGD